MSFLTIIILGIYTADKLQKMATNADHTYTVSSNDYNLKDLGVIKVKDYKSPFLYVLSFRNEDQSFDISDNQFIQVQANIEIGEGGVVKDKDTKLRKCSIEELEQIFNTNEMSYYQESICIDEQSETSLQANYMNYLQYRAPYLTVVECKNTTDNNDKCASPQEI